ncbi:hypothetical protein [Bacillus sp. CHD6a]|uniref:hypothetical protein n=1 Tax=Bacillus sp. CHD6a TaxID=1643452 RepID=UPI0006CD11BF|nr:hypothetical protein [Bacillus sp. CHD6a]KPB03664.1 hypothetical protein AAV98_15875 [Bacillus sp. CHD6a]
MTTGERQKAVEPASLDDRIDYFLLLLATFPLCDVKTNRFLPFLTLFPLFPDSTSHSPLHPHHIHDKITYHLIYLNQEEDSIHHELF